MKYSLSAWMLTLAAGTIALTGRLSATSLGSDACIQDGGTTPISLVTLCLPAPLSNETAKRVTVLEKSRRQGSAAFLFKPIFETITTERSLLADLSPYGRPGSFTVKSTPLGAHGQSLAESPSIINFSTTGTGPDLDYLPNRQYLLDHAEDFTITGKGLGGAAYDFQCWLPSSSDAVTCPPWLRLSQSGEFNVEQGEEFDLIVRINVNTSAGSDSQAFRLSVIGPGPTPVCPEDQPVCPDPGGTNLITDLPGDTEVLTVTSAAVRASSERTDHYRHYAVNGEMATNQTWMPDSPHDWQIVIKISEVAEQRLYWINKVWINFGTAGALSSIPDTSIPGQLVLSFSQDFEGSPDSFYPIDTDMNLDPLFDFGIVMGGPPSCEVIGDTCEGSIVLNQAAAFIALSGTGVMPAIEEVILSGYPGPEDCDREDPARWRDRAFYDLNNDCWPDTSGLVSVACYGVHTMLPPGYLAPERVRHGGCGGVARSPLSANPIAAY